MVGFSVAPSYTLPVTIGVAIFTCVLATFGVLFLFRKGHLAPIDIGHKPGTRDAVFEAIFNNTFQFTGLLTPAGKLIEANKTALDFARLSLDEIREQYFWDTFWWRHDTAVQLRVKEAVHRAAKGEFVRFDDLVQNADHQLITIDFSLRPVFDAQGNVVLLIPEGRDIQEQVNIRAALEESETRFRTMVNNAKIGVTLLAPDGSVIYGNEFIRDLLGGFTLQEYRKIKFAEYTHPDDLASSQVNLQALQTGAVEAYDLTMRYITRLNDTLWVSLNVSAVTNQQGELKYILSLAQDITRQMEMEVELQDNEKKYRTLVEQSPVAYVIHQDGKIVFANTKAVEISGLEDEKALIGQDMLAFVSEPYKEIARERMQRMMTTQKPEHPMKQVLVNVKGDEFVVEAIPNPILYNGRPAVQVAIQDITILEKTKQQIEKSEFILRNAERIAKVGSWELDLSTNQALWSEVMHEIFEWPIENGALHQDDILNMVHPDDVSAVQRSLEALVQGRSSGLTEYRVTLPSGKTKYLEARHSIINNVEGQVMSIIGTVQDVTQRNLSEKELRDSRMQLKNLTNSIPGTVLRYELDESGSDRILFISDGVINIWGVTADEATQDINNLWQHIPATYIPAMRDSIMASAQSLTQWKHEWPVHMPTGENRWLLGLGVPSRQPNGSTIWDTIILDITQQKEAEQALVESEQRFRSLFHNNLAGVYQIDLLDDKRVLSCNQAFVDILGYQSVHEVVGRSVRELFTSFTEREFYDRLIQQGQLINWESKLRLKNGHILQTLENATLLYDKGEPRFMEGTLFDISKLKSAEAERIRLIEQLTFQNKNLEDFAYIVSHNLRSPVAALLGLTSLAEAKKENAELLAQVLERMRLSAEELDTIIKDLNVILTTKRNSSQEKEWVDMAKLLQGIVNLQKHDIDLADGRVIIDLGEAEKLFAFKGYLHNIFFNLISNGFKYRSPDRSPVVEIRANKKGKRIQIEVKDNGIGLDLNQFGNKLFSLYQRFHDHVEGRGIGLYLVRSQVENMGGHITVDSEPGKGTSFFVYFDVDKVQPASAESFSVLDDTES